MLGVRLGGLGRERLRRLRRLLPLAVLLAIAALYVGPVGKYRRLEHQLAEQRATLTALDRQRAQLLAERAALHTRPRLVLLARQCGWIFPGERAFVVSGVGGDDEANDCR